MSFFHKFKSNYMIPVLSKIILAILAVVMVPFYIKYWGVDTYKEYVLILSLMAYANIIANPLSNFLLKLQSKSKFINLLEIGIINAILIVVFIIPLMTGYLYANGNSINIILYSFALIFLVSFTALLKTSYIAVNMLNIFSFMEISFNLIKQPLNFFLLYIFVSGKDHFNLFFIIYIISLFLENLVYIYYLYKKRKVYLKNKFSYVFKRLLEQKSSYLYFCGVVVLEVLIGTFDRLYLVSFATNNDFVSFTLSLTIVSSFYLVVSQINSQSLVQFYNAKSIQEKKNLIKVYAKEIIFALLPMILIYILLGSFLIDIWLNSSVNENIKNNIFEISLILTLGIILNSLSGPIQNFFISISKEKIIMKYNIYFVFILVSSLVIGYTFGNIFLFAMAFSFSYFMKFILYAKGVFSVG